MTYQAFPITLLRSLGCTHDGSALHLDPTAELNPTRTGVRHGLLRCGHCRAAFPIDEGIVNLLAEPPAHPESRREQALRDAALAAAGGDADTPWWQDEHNAMEMASTLEALSLTSDVELVELGCGDGRYTLPLAARCRSVLAIDFSRASLRQLARRLPAGSRVGLALGDVQTLRTAPGRFDRVFSTLASNLPTDAHRQAMVQLAAEALRPDGRFVFNTHHHGYWQRRRGEPKSGHYQEGGIYRYQYSVQECRAQAQACFADVQAHPIQIYPPMAHRLGLPLVTVSRWLEHVPLVNQLGMLVLCTASRPVVSRRTSATVVRAPDDIAALAAELFADIALQPGPATQAQRGRPSAKPGAVTTLGER